MQDEEVGVNVVEWVKERDLKAFHSYAITQFTRAYVPGEVPGKEFPEGTIVTVANYENEYILRIFPVAKKGSKGRRIRFMHLKELEAIISLEALKKIYPGKWSHISWTPYQGPGLCS